MVTIIFESHGTTLDNQAHYGLEHWIKGVSVSEAVTAPWKWQPGWTYLLKEI